MPVAVPTPGRIFEALETEHDYWLDEVEGRLPDDLAGTLYRNGPGRLEIGGSPLGHMFDGDGMLAMFAFDGGRVRFRNRYVRTSHYRAGQSSVGAPMRGLGTLRPGGPLANALRMPANVANTSVALHAGELLALWEGGKPHALDPDTLATRGVYDFDGQLRWLGAFSAHPKVDPLTGDLYNFGAEVVPRPALRSYRVDTRGRMHRLGAISLPEPVFCHDFALTQQNLVFVVDPLGLAKRALPGVLLGLTSFDRALRFDAGRGTTILIQPRDGGKVRRITVPAFLHFHISNAYDDGTDVVVDLVRWDRDWESFNQSLRAYRPDDPDRPDDWQFGGVLTRLRITPADRVIIEELADVFGEFPQLDQRRATRAHRFSYLAGRVRPGEEADAIVGIDHELDRVRAHALPPGHTVSEPVFVPRSDDAAEDDGWLLAVAYDPFAHRSRLLVLDARRIEDAAVFVGHLPHHLPQSFHGTFTSRVARP
ncbi:carotenoid oxygenase family protein [Nocardioides sp. Bht2]|uniref:carotenoid oxygenase family protein n=1 Tax=Nocardioides sp. Bht2 TaxID=3392297 RepID=UPI0039B61029